MTLRLRTPRLLLRPYEARDLADLAAIRADPEVVRLLQEDVLDRAGAADLLRNRMVLDRLVTPGDTLVLAAEHEGRVIGDVALHWTSAEHHQGSIGVILHPDAHGHGYAHEAAAAVLDLAFDEVALHRVEGRCDARNTPSAALMRRLGMRQEAHLVENQVVRGTWCSEYVFAVLEHEWRARRRD